MKGCECQKAPIVGGNANNGANAGFGNVNSNNEASDTNTNIGGRLNCNFFIFLLASQPHLLVKKRTLKKGIGSESEGSFLTQLKMIRHANLFVKICSMENLQLADVKARKGKKCISEIVSFDRDRDNLLDKLATSLNENTFKTSKYYIFKKVVDSGKEREIFRLPYYPDRILHHAIMNVIEPLFRKCFTADTYSCIIGRGIHNAAEKFKNDIRQPGSAYALKLDVKKFYPSIDHEILKSIIRKKIKDKDLLWLLDEIIDSTHGLPIGNYLSQSFANLYLSGFDHWIKEVKGVKYYFRYCDDIVILHDDKAFLHALRVDISEYLNGLKLTVKKDWRVFPVTTGVDFLGFVFYPTHTKLRKSIKKRFIRSAKRYRENPSEENRITLSSYWGWLKYCDSINLIKKTRA